MSISLSPRQQPEQQMRMVTIDEILSLWQNYQDGRPDLDHYFSPTKKEHFIKEFIHYLNTLLLEMKHRNPDSSSFLVFILTFQFIGPLLKIPLEKELVLFCKILEQRYEIDEPDLNLHFSTDEFDEGMVAEEEAIKKFLTELNKSYEGKREVKTAVQQRLKEDGIYAIMQWLHTKDLPELAEAFGRCIIIPSFFEYTDRKLVNFYRRNTQGIYYMTSIPDLDNSQSV